MTDSRRPLAATIAAFSAAIYWALFEPGHGFRDSPLFLLAAHTWGIPHPPGSPLWVILAGLAGPRLLCAASAGVTIGIAYLIAGRLVGPVDGRDRSLTGSALPLLAPLMLAASPSFLEQATSVEQYTLLTALLAAFVLLGLDGAPGQHSSEPASSPEGDLRRPSTADRRPLLLGLLAGLAAANHLSQIVLVPVALAVAAFRFGTGGASRGSRILQAALGCGLGLLVYAWVPWRSRAEPMLDWGDVETAERFWWAITRQQWAARPLSEVPPGFVAAWLGSYNFLFELSIAGAPLAAIGAVRLARRSGRAALLLAACCLPYAAGIFLGHLRQQGMTVAYIRDYGIGDWHLPLYLAGALLVPLGVEAILEVSRAAGKAAAYAAGMAGIGFCAVHSGDRAVAFPAPGSFAATLTRPHRDSNLFLSADNLSFPIGYAHVAEPRDGLAIAWPSPSLPEFASREIASAGSWSAEAQARFERDVVADPRRNMLRMAIPAGRPAITEFDRRFPATAAYMVPAGLLFEMRQSKTTDEAVREAEGRVALPARPDFRGEFQYATRAERFAWAEVFERRGNFFAIRGMWDLAEENYGRAREWAPWIARLAWRLGEAIERQGRADAAAPLYFEAIGAEPSLAGVRLYAALAEARAGRLAEAARLLEEELALDPANATAAKVLEQVRADLQAR